MDYFKLKKAIRSTHCSESDNPYSRHELVIDESNFLLRIETISNLLKGEYENQSRMSYANRRLWFRGERENGRLLLPKFLRGNMSSYEEEYPYLSMYNRIQEFKFHYSANGNCDISDAAYFALMKYSSINSTFLEFTEDSLTAMYFSLKNVMDDYRRSISHAKGQDSGFYKNVPVLYIFCPELYNIALRDMIKEKCTEESEYLSSQETRELISSFKSLHGNETIPDISLCGDMIPYKYCLCPDKFRENDKYKNTLCNRTADYYMLPLTVRCSQPNPKMNSHGGCFLAYNTFIPYSIYKKNPFDLESIQNCYLQMFENRSPFLYKLRIDISNGIAPKKIAGQLLAAGFNRINLTYDFDLIGNLIESQYHM